MLSDYIHVFNLKKQLQKLKIFSCFLFHLLFIWSFLVFAESNFIAGIFTHLTAILEILFDCFSGILDFDFIMQNYLII